MKGAAFVSIHAGKNDFVANLNLTCSVPRRDGTALQESESSHRGNATLAADHPGELSSWPTLAA